jgi:hypothetical protein
MSEDHKRRLHVGFVSMFLGLGFGVPGAFGIYHAAQTGQVLTFMGFPTYGNGPFEQIGVEASTELLVGFLAVCVSEVALAVMLWTGAPHAAALSYALLPFELVFLDRIRAATGTPTRRRPNRPRADGKTPAHGDTKGRRQARDAPPCG